MIETILKEAITIVIGKQFEKIVDLLNTPKYVNEFIIAKKLDITINQTRNILYKLSDQGLVSSIRKKDKKKGWYTYFWKIENLKCLEFLRKILERKLEQITHQINSRESKHFYICEKCNIECSEEHALLNNFTCNECGAIFTLKDNTKVLKEFKKNLDKINLQIIEIDKELEMEKFKIEKQKTKENKKIEKKEKAIKDAKSALRKKERAKLKKKEAKSTNKKESNKKSAKNKTSQKKSSKKKKK